jgi:lysophospholipase L1-like esterase
MFAQERNALKFRGKEFDFIKNKRFRIVILGDSISYGQGVYPYSLRYSDQVEKQMNISFPEPGVEVINLGTCGHDLPQHIHLLHFVKALHPDFVLYQWFINDMDIMGRKHETMAPRLINNHYLHKTLMNNSSLYFFVQKGWYNFLQRRRKILTYEQHMKGLYADENAIGTQKSNKALLQLLDGIKNFGVPYGIVLFPNAAYKIKDYPFAYIHTRIMKICTNYGIPCLDLQSAYSSFDDHLEKLWVNQLDPHPSVLAHTIAAKNIMNYFGKRWQQLAVLKH